MYLNKEQVVTNLKIGKAIEQWIGYSTKKEYTLLKWLRIDKEKNGSYSVAYFEVFDEGNLDFLDIYEFSSLEPDEPYGIIDTFKSIEEVLNFANTEYGSQISNYINSGMIQEEYKKFLHSRV